MVIVLESDLEAAVSEAAQREGVRPEDLALNALRQRFLVSATSMMPRDQWERCLRDAATNCGVSLPHWAVSSEGLYE